MMKEKDSKYAELINRNNIILSAFTRYMNNEITGLTYDKIYNYHIGIINKIINELGDNADG